MATKITNDDILRINELYYKCKVYAQVARETGFSASTVKKYVIPGWKPVEQKIIKFDPSTILSVDAYSIEPIDLGAFCVLSETEKEGMAILWKEMSL